MAESSKENKLAVVIMAAGKGTRMKNPDMAKVMYEIEEKPMVHYVVDLAVKIQSQRTLLIVGWQKQSVIGYIKTAYPQVEFVEQNEQRGTGHAVMQTTGSLKDFTGDVLVLSGDVPLLSERTARALLGYHKTSAASATILTAELDDPTGYGRVVRNDDDSVKKIVEHKDASKQELKIREINSGIYCFDCEKLFQTLATLTPNNAQGEYYLTDVFETFWKNKWRVSAVKAIDPVEVMGINDLDQLNIARELIRARKQG
jgi:UDP-N-acetylglucosamine diphosphorylase/glucosamine-1-phosphate N-acetyltransferase